MIGVPPSARFEALLMAIFPPLEAVRIITGFMD